MHHFRHNRVRFRRRERHGFLQRIHQREIGIIRNGLRAMRRRTVCPEPKL